MVEIYFNDLNKKAQKELPFFIKGGNMSLEKYDELIKRVRNYMEVKQTSYGNITAVKALRKEDLDLAAEMWEEGKSSCTDNCRPEIKYEFTGPDWYFIEEYDDWPYGKIFEVESLSYKKQKFEEFCRDYE